MFCSTEMFVCGIGVIGAFGSTLEALTHTISSQTIPSLKSVVISKEPSAPQYPIYDSAVTDELKRYFPIRQVRRLDSFSALALFAARACLESSSLLQMNQDFSTNRIGIIIATGYGPVATTFAFLEDIIENGEWAASPTKFSLSIQNAAATQLGMLLNLKGPAHTVSVFELSFPSILPLAWYWLKTGEVDYVLVGGVDELTPAVAYCYHRMFGDPPSRMDPLDFHRQTAIPGEGAGFFLLSRSPGPQRWGKILAFASGYRNSWPEVPSISDCDYLLGCDGHLCTAHWYDEFLRFHHLHPHQFRASSWAYGSFPTITALDLAVALTALPSKRPIIEIVRYNPYGEGWRIWVERF